ncbi:substrate-binding domain-containing protein [Roseibacillus ishigakijimensis]|uniref:GntR family transcriptional regulator n=1 Tax=Roseibacillus ishigakijimensis TaxID=454146 RepID=A0A934RKT1_9BACT|nr:substrate-binding domain-containing protein [Roseibacillus ishigakijimensis]MBK1833542.1 GntR family transcriptional regulator [Roseibacillus ishigakijimensis]
MASPLDRSALHQQLYQVLRREISQGRWQGTLPSEAALCRELQVSRMTLRKSLQLLAEEGILAFGGRGKHHRILAVAPAIVPRTGRIIRVLTPFDLGERTSTDNELLGALRERLGAAGYQLELEAHRGIFTHFKPSLLAQWDAQPETAGWILCYGTASIHRWFSERDKPAVVLGRKHDEIKLPSVVPDSLAAARHAAGRFRQYGHRKVLYLIGHPTSLGDQTASRIFVEEARALGMEASVESHQSTARSVASVLRRLSRQPEPPTGILVGSTEASISTLCFLLGEKKRIPQEAALIAMWDDANLEATLPSIARYRSSGARMGRLLGKVMLEQLVAGHPLAVQHAVMPDYLAGGSIGPLEA